MKLLGPVFLIVGLVVGGYLVMSGKLTGITSGASTGNAGAVAGQGIQKAKDAGGALYAQPWFWSGAFAVAGATLLRWLWKNMSGPVRGAFIVVITLLVAYFVTSVVKH